MLEPFGTELWRHFVLLTAFQRVPVPPQTVKCLALDDGRRESLMSLLGLPFSLHEAPIAHKTVISLQEALCFVCFFYLTRLSSRDLEQKENFPPDLTDVNFLKDCFQLSLG